MKKVIEKKPKAEKKMPVKKEIIYNDDFNYVCEEPDRTRHILAFNEGGAKFHAFLTPRRGLMPVVSNPQMAIDLALFNGCKVIEMDSPAKALEFVLAQYKTKPKKAAKKPAKKSLTAKSAGGKIK